MNELNFYLNKIPVWLRWILFIPIALIASTIVSFLNLFSSSYLSIPRTLIYLFNNFISIAIFIVVSYIIVPKYKYIVSFILTIIITILTTFNIFLILGSYTRYLNYPVWIEITARVIMIISAIVSTIAIYQHEDELKNIDNYIG